MKRKGSFTWMLILVVALTMVLSACSGGNTPASTNGGSSNGGEKPPAATNGGSNNGGGEKAENGGDVDVNKDPVTIKFISWKENYGPLYDLFHEMYPWITIEQVPVNGGNIMEIIAALEVAGTPADVVEMDDLLAFDQAGLLEDLTPYLDKSEIMKNTVLPDGLFDTMSYNGKKLAVPMVDVPMWVLVNKDLLAKNGVEMPANDWTYEDMRRIAKEITDPVAGEFGFTTQAEIQMRLMSTKAVADGHAANLQYMNEDLTQSVMNKPEILNIARWFQELVTVDGSLQNDADADAGGALTRQFINGKTGFAIGGDWVLPDLKKNATFEWDVLPFPKGEVSQPGYTIYGPLGLLTGSQNQEAGFLWLSFQFTEVAQKWKIDQGANASVIDQKLLDYYDETPMWEGKNKEAVKIAKENAKIQVGNTVPAWGEYNWNNIMNEIMFGPGEKTVNDIIPLVEQWNRLTLEARKEIDG
ncbi:extracellular solute-binding protein [Paenibacillaceae bacterium]|nr:extracellular solute-binding protein [Paenibacillaceae bacterium]